MRCRGVVSPIVKVPMKHETSRRSGSNDSSRFDGRQAVPSRGSAPKIRKRSSLFGRWGVEMQFVGQVRVLVDLGAWFEASFVTEDGPVAESTRVTIHTGGVVGPPLRWGRDWTMYAVDQVPGRRTCPPGPTKEGCVNCGQLFIFFGWRKPKACRL